MMELPIKRGIITAMQEEGQLIVEKFSLKEVKKLQNISIFEGGEKDNIVLAICGIGKIQAAIATSYLIENYELPQIINIGIAGNIGNTDIRVGDVVLPNTFIQHDMYLPFEGVHLDYAKKPIFLEYAIGENYDLEKFGVILSGVCLTGDQFIDDDAKVLELKEMYSADICEMEAFAILSVAREYGLLEKCVVIKAVSDGADSDAKDEHMSNLEFAMQNSIAILEFMISE